MPLSNAGLRAAEKSVLALTDPDTAHLFCAVLAAHLEHDTKLLIEAHLDLDEIAIRWDLPSDEAFCRIEAADQRFQAAFDFSMFDLKRRRHSRPWPRGVVVALSPIFQLVLLGDLIERVDLEGDIAPLDASTQRQVAMVAAVAKNAQAAPFLCIGESGSDELADVRRLAMALDAHDVGVLRLKMEPMVAFVPLSAALLCCRVNYNGGILAIQAASIVKSGKQDKEAPEEADAIPAADLDEHVLDAACTIAYPIIALGFRHKRLPRHALKWLSGAIGPLRVDRSWAISELHRLSADLITPTKAETLLDLVGEPSYATAVVKAAEAIATTKGKWSHSLRDSQHTNPTPSRGRATTKRQFDEASTELLAPLMPYVEFGRGLSISSAPFDGELFVSDVDVMQLFRSAPLLRREGARILVAGPMGTGKTQFVHALARAAGFDQSEIAAHSGADLFARAWGRAEANIKAAIEGAAGTLVFFDEADSLMGTRFSDDQSGNQHLVATATNAFLNAMQGNVGNSIIVAATNRLQVIDPGLRRRFDIILTTAPLPKEKEVVAYRRLLNLSPPADWSPIGGTVPADYIKASRMMRLLGRAGFEQAFRFVQKARNERDPSCEARTFGFF